MTGSENDLPPRGPIPEPLEQDQRNALVGEYFRAFTEYQAVTQRLQAANTEADYAAIEPLHDRLRDKLGAVWDEYSDRAPLMALSRCPISDRIAYHSFDPWGLDGLWWNSQHPARPIERQLPSYFALAGAVRLADQVERFPFLCKPGPEAPFVVPRLLQEAGIYAVVSSTPVGSHIAYPIFYFAQAPSAVARFNTWGTNQHTHLDDSGWQRWDEVPEDPGDLDFDLSRWIRAGKLLWIAPGDDFFQLRRDVENCPYLNLPGRHEPLRIQDGEVWA